MWEGLAIWIKYYPAQQGQSTCLPKSAHGHGLHGESACAHVNEHVHEHDHGDWHHVNEE